MLNFITRRLTFIGLVCVLIIFVTQMGMAMVPNSEVREPSYELGPILRQSWAQTKDYLSKALQGDFGLMQASYGLVRVRTVVAEAYINSMGLMLISLAFAGITGLLAGSIAALAQRQRWVLPILALTLLGMSTPSFFAGLLLRQGELLYLRSFGRALVSMAGLGWDYQHLLMPVLVLASRPLAYITRSTFLAFNQVMEADYIRTALAKGLTQIRTINLHALRNAAIPILTGIGVSLRFVLSTLPIVEFFFFWPGLGLRMLEAIDGRQTDLVIALALAMGLTFLGVNLLLDLLYRLIDPRLRQEAV